MKATLQFNLPEETEEFQIAVKAPDLNCAFEDFKNWLFQILDENYDNYSEEQLNTFQLVQNKLYEYTKDIM